MPTPMLEPMPAIRWLTRRPEARSVAGDDVREEGQEYRDDRCTEQSDTKDCVYGRHAGSVTSLDYGFIGSFPVEPNGGVTDLQGPQAPRLVWIDLRVARALRERLERLASPLEKLGEELNKLQASRVNERPEDVDQQEIPDGRRPSPTASGKCRRRGSGRNIMRDLVDRHARAPVARPEGHQAGVGEGIAECTLSGRRGCTGR